MNRPDKKRPRWPTNAIFALLAVLLTATVLNGQEDSPEAEKLPDKPPQLTIGNAVVLGVVEGITEFLPISSTGHLILTNRILGLDREIQSVDRHGNPIWAVPPGEDPARDPGQPYLFKEAVDAYTIVIQGGAIIAVALLYWRRIFSVLEGAIGRNRQGLLLARNLLLSFLPAAIIGLLLESWIEAHLFGPLPVAIALAAGGGIMLAVEAWKKRQTPDAADGATAGLDLHELSIGQSLFIGVLQCVAMWPGTSRSMITIVAGYLTGLSLVRAAEYSFLLGLITLTAAAGYKAVQSGPIMLQVLDPLAVVVGCAVAFGAALISVHWLIRYLTSHGLALFAYYRFALAIAVVIYLV